jgi:hypothetical protein
VVSFTPRPLYPRNLLDRRLGGPQSRSGRHGEEKILDPTGTRTPTPRSSRPLPVAIPTELSRLLFCTVECRKIRLYDSERTRALEGGKLNWMRFMVVSPSHSLTELWPHAMLSHLYKRTYKEIFMGFSDIMFDKVPIHNKWQKLFPPQYFSRSPYWYH